MSVFIDIDECSRWIDNCHSDAYCTNTDGSFLCTCGIGYTGNGTVCQGKCQTKLPSLRFTFQIIGTLGLTPSQSGKPVCLFIF